MELLMAAVIKVGNCFRRDDVDCLNTFNIFRRTKFQNFGKNRIQVCRELLGTPLSQEQWMNTA